MSFIPQKIVGIDFHDYSAQVVELKHSGGKGVLEAYNRVELPPEVIQNGEIHKPEELKDHLRKLLQKANPGPVDSKNVAVVFPPSRVLTHIFTFPANLDEKEIAKSIPFEAETIIPYAITDIYWDFMVLEKEEKGKKHASQRVLFAAITKETADAYVDILEAVGLSPSLFAIHSETLKYALSSQMEDEKTNMIIDMESLSVNYQVIHNGILKHYYSTNEGGKRLFQEIAKELQVPEKSIVQEKEKDKLSKMPNLPRVNEFIEKNYKRGQKIMEEQIASKRATKIDNIYLTGEFLNFPNFFDTAQTYFPNQKIILGDPKMGLKIDEQRFIPPDGKEEKIPYSIYFANTIGVALRGISDVGIDHGINLLPDRLKEGFASRKNGIFVAIMSVLMTIITLALGTFFAFQYQSLTYDRLHLEMQKASVEKLLYGTRYQQIRDGIIQFNSEVEDLTKIDQTLFSTPDLISKIKDQIPSGVEITSIKFMDSELKVGITGIAKSRSNLLATQANFEKAEFVNKVVAPISNFDEREELSFLLEIELQFTELNQYGAGTGTK